MRARRGWIAIAAAALLLTPPPSALAQTVQLSTPYPAVSVQAGGQVTFDIEVRASSRERVNLRVAAKPKGWGTTLRGGGFVVDGVFAEPKDPPQVQLEVQIPAEVKAGTHRVVVSASAPGGSDTLELDLRISKSAEGGVELTADYPSLQGSSDTTFTFNLTLANNVPKDATFGLEAQGPEGWVVDAVPAGQEQAATLTVEGGSTGSITVTADPPDDVVAGEYPLAIRASGGGQEAGIDLTVEITGDFQMTLATPDERLNAEVTSGGTTQVPVVVRNGGTAPLQNVELTSTPPSGWTVTFVPKTIPEVAAGATANAIARITPADDAIAGDYMVTLEARIPETTSQIEMRTTVKTSPLWGFFGLLLIVGALVGLGYVFRRYGRR